MNNNTTHTIELTYGFTDENGVTHRRVTFGRRTTTQDMINLDNNPLLQVYIQQSLLIARIGITKFGNLPLVNPQTGEQSLVELSHLLELDSVDITDLLDASLQFSSKSRGERTARIIDERQTILAFGFEIEGTRFDLVTFGRRFTGHDWAAADAQKLTGVSRLCFDISRQMAKLTSSETGATIDAHFSPEIFRTLDVQDLEVLKLGCEAWRQSPPVAKTSIQDNQNCEDFEHSELTH